MYLNWECKDKVTGNRKLAKQKLFMVIYVYKKLAKLWHEAYSI
ncbi:hypothetical protein MC7420_8131 [Coleofasciculus chthonoplastes PCC 7420]|uniref:Uncharacterized protein n=1 Tax=Coleofasciculus chthonoplastes PCC 7420 TaxID=118168 RepID=B4W536_9CYAN|nr:hypothetical protein MC7420_8131 [Coleofasciculus chthonoplastes PCC 7420]